mmetsp:Transcript_7559/g.22165  ORF Transcript_7559/g.22165 Transcript_7559/m.22165 type:complete len:225 (-) Transcript_7559:1062-1736(-)
MPKVGNKILRRLLAASTIPSSLPTSNMWPPPRRRGPSRASAASTPRPPRPLPPSVGPPNPTPHAPAQMAVAATTATVISKLSTSRKSAARGTIGTGPWVWKAGAAPSPQGRRSLRTPLRFLGELMPVPALAPALMQIERRASQMLIPLRVLRPGGWLRWGEIPQRLSLIWVGHRLQWARTYWVEIVPRVQRALAVGAMAMAVFLVSMPTSMTLAWATRTLPWRC